MAQNVVHNRDDRQALYDGADVLDPTFDALRKLRVAVWIYDIEKSCVAFANEAALALWNATTEEELYARDLSLGMSNAVAQRLRQYQKDFIERSATFTENWTLYPKGEPVALNLIYSGYRLSDGRMAMLCEVLNTVQEDPDNLRRTDALLHADVMVSMFEEDGPPIYFNPAARRTTLSTTQHFSQIFVEPEDYQDLMFGVYDRGENRIVANVHSVDGETWHDMSVRRCKDPATGGDAILVTAIDVTELKTARDQARFLAETDPLTNCANRNFLNNRLDVLMQAGAATGSGLLLFDLDRFKQVNDSFGHHVGDAVLKEAAARVLGSLQPNETFARLGGDEFVLLMEGRQEKTVLLERAEQIRAELAEPIQCGAARLQVSASIGGALVTEDVTDWGEAMRRADIAQYQSKIDGRNRFTYYTDALGRAAQDRLLLEKDLLRAIREGQFTLHYQPRVDLTTGRVSSVEALVRWEHPTRGMISPGAFIPLCEETGMIEALGTMILQKACAQARKWQQQGQDIGVSINVSPRQFQSEELIANIREIAGWPGFRTDKIEFEITESVLVGDDAAITDRILAINDLGFKIALDDFGTGYSNLANISRFPLHCIKIDKSFVDQLPGSDPIIQLVVTLAHHVGATVVAEGAEEAEQVHALMKLGCEEIQGFFFSKPVSTEHLGDAIAKIGRVFAKLNAQVNAEHISKQSNTAISQGL